MILVCGAVAAELNPLRADVARGAAVQIGGRPAWQGRIGGEPVILLETGVGTANAVQAVTAAVETRDVRLIIATGCAGGFEAADMRIGDVVVGTEAIDVHLGVEPSDGGSIPQRLPIPIIQGDHGEGWGRYPAASGWCEQALAVGRSIGATQRFAVHAGACVTVGTVTATDRRARELVAAWHPAAEAMEGAGIAHTAVYYGIDWLEIRGISNRVGQRDRRQWDIPLACAHAGSVVAAVIRAAGPSGETP